jgi:hypothetical protein
LTSKIASAVSPGSLSASRASLSTNTSSFYKLDVNKAHGDMVKGEIEDHAVNLQVSEGGGGLILHDVILTTLSMSTSSSNNNNHHHHPPPHPHH